MLRYPYILVWSAVLIFYLRIVLSDLAFYRRTGWDFRRDNPMKSSKEFYWGEVGIPQMRMGNKTRVLVFHPVITAFISVLLFVLAFLT